MTDTQFYLAMGIPILANAALIGLLLVCLNARFNAVDARFDSMNAGFDSIDAHFERQAQHFIERLQYFEEVLDTRLKRIEDKLSIR